MSISAEVAVIAALKANAALAALVGTRISIFGGQQNVAFPYVTVQRISTAGTAHLNGPATLEWPRLQIDAWSPSAVEALSVSEAVRTAIDGFEQTAAGLVFTATLQDQRGPAPDEVTRDFSVSQDYFVFNQRS